MEFFKMTKGQMLTAILCNYFTLFLLVGCGCCAVWVPTVWGKVGAVLAGLYVVPLILVRLLLAIHPLRQTKIQMFSADYFVWWFSYCAQLVYLRFPFLEEVLRVVPGFYSLWLRAWGAKIGKFVYWTPGTLVMDRPFIHIGNHVHFGLGSRVCPHLHVEGELWLAPVEIEDRVLLGAYSTLAAGAVIKADQSTKAFLIAPPFSVWQNNRRIVK